MGLQKRLEGPGQIRLVFQQQFVQVILRGAQRATEFLGFCVQEGVRLGLPGT